MFSIKSLLILVLEYLGQHQTDVTKVGNLNPDSSSLHPIKTLYLWSDYHAKGTRLFCMYFINLSIIKNIEGQKSNLSYEFKLDPIIIYHIWFVMKMFKHISANDNNKIFKPKTKDWWVRRRLGQEKKMM